MRYLIVAFFVLNALLCTARKPVVVHFEPYAGSGALVADKNFTINGKDSLRITALRFYIGHVRFLNKGEVVFATRDDYHLIDAALLETLNIKDTLPATTSYDAVRFELGVDSTVNASGAQGGELDAVKGMYWAWQSGYINFKLEGVSPQCKTRKHEFQYHLGGFRGADYCMQVITLPVRSKDGVVRIRIDLDRFLSSVDMSTDPQIMSPGAAAVKLSQLAASMFQSSVTER